MTLQVGDFDNLSHFKTHGVLCGEKGRFHGQISLQNKAQSWKFAIYISIIKASGRKPFLWPPSSLLRTLIIPQNCQSLQEVLTGDSDSPTWLVVTRTWHTCEPKALWSHTRAAESESLRLKGSSSCFRVHWTVSLPWGHRSMGSVKISIFQVMTLHPDFSRACMWWGLLYETTMCKLLPSFL